MPDPRQTVYEPVLVLRCQLGDGAAFAEIVARYHRRVHYYLKKMLGSADRADDALQELWIDVFRSIPTLRDARAFSSWLYRLARDRAYREIRRSRHAGPQPASAESIDDVPADSDDDAFSPEDAARVHDALDRLGTEHREVLLLRFVESMTYPQIAAIVGCELGTVRSRLHYAKRALRRLLERNQDEQQPRIRIATE
ncbi:MAG TPA: sigma-70 family RNA polymerase sigma factor [Tepidisphaeraceae bacterium]|jgi:RNA polymerase sigma-70 factor (ECF subfamily)